MNDPFGSYSQGMTSPAVRHYEITPSDSEELPIRPRALYCTVAGDAVIRDELGTDVTYPLSAGEVLPIRATQVLATGTTASLVGWY